MFNVKEKKTNGMNFSCDLLYETCKVCEEFSESRSKNNLVIANAYKLHL